MALTDFIVNMDMFEAEIISDFHFPCCICKYRYGKDTEYPCVICDHNLLDWEENAQ